MHSSRFHKSAIGLIALACLGVSANAETITFATSGVFTSTNYATTYGSSVTDTLLTTSTPHNPTTGSATLSFAGFSTLTPGSVTVNDGDQSNISFGEFTLTLVAPVPAVSASATMNYGFKLTVNQLTPSGAISDPATPVFAGQIAGNVNFTYNPTTGTGSSTSLKLTFPNDVNNDPQSITFYTPTTAVTYYVDNIRLAAPQTNNGVTTVQGILEFSRTAPAPVPTPAAVWSGCGLLGFLGAARLRKRSASQN